MEHPHKAPSRQVWLDEQTGRPTRYNIYRADVQKAIDSSITGRGMVQYLRGRGYIVDSTGPNLKIRLPQYPHFTRLDTLNPQWTNQEIERLIYDRDNLVSSRSKPPRKPDIPDWLKEAYPPRKRTTKIYRLYLYYRLSNQVQAEMAEIGKKKDRLLELSIAGAMTVEEFKQRNDAFNARLSQCESQLRAIEQEAEQASKGALDLAEIRRCLEQELSFEGEPNEALLTTILEKIV